MFIFNNGAPNKTQLNSHVFRLNAISCLLLCSLLSACAPVNVKLDSKIMLPATFEQVPTNAQAEPIDQWWLSWQDPTLNQLIADALKDNKDLAKTRDLLSQARSQARLAQADLGPMVGAQVSGDLFNAHAKNPLPDMVGDIPLAPPLIDSNLLDSWKSARGSLINGGINASWEPDFFGKKQSDSDAARYGALAEEERWHAAQMLLTTEITKEYYQRQYFLEKKRLNQQEVNYLKQLKNYVDGRFNAGQATAYNTQEIESKLEASIAAGASFQAQADHALRQLAVLSGQVPQQFQLPIPSYKYGQNLPSPPEGQTPANILNQRPDIRALQNKVYAHSALLASAKADLLPRFNLNFLGSTGQLELNNDMPDLKGYGGLVSLGISIPIFTAGRIQANIDAKDAGLKAALNEYDHAILKALSEVDSAYQAQLALNRQQNLFEKAQTSAKKQADSATQLFKYGNQNLDTAIRTHIEKNNLDSKALDIAQARINNMLNLYKTIGAGWTAEKIK